MQGEISIPTIPALSKFASADIDLYPTNLMQ